MCVLIDTSVGAGLFLQPEKPLLCTKSYKKLIHISYQWSPDRVTWIRSRASSARNHKGKGCACSYGEPSRMSKMLETDRGCGGRGTGGAAVEIQGEQGLDFSELVFLFQRALSGAQCTRHLGLLLPVAAPVFSQQVCSSGGNLGFIPLSGHAWQNGFHGPFRSHPCSWKGSSLPAHCPTLLMVSICCFQTEVSTFQQLCLILKKSKQGLQCEAWVLDRLSEPLQECPRVDRWAGAEQGIPAMGPDMHRCNVTHWYLQEE